jgi:Domain of unknown function (DUF397)
MRVSAVLHRKAYLHSHGVRSVELDQALWHKSTFSNMNGSCVEVSRLSADRIGVRDTKDKGAGPVLIFTNAEWDAFISGAKVGQFD